MDPAGAQRHRREQEDIGGENRAFNLGEQQQAHGADSRDQDGGEDQPGTEICRKERRKAGWVAGDVVDTEKLDAGVHHRADVGHDHRRQYDDPVGVGAQLACQIDGRTERNQLGQRFANPQLQEAPADGSVGRTHRRILERPPFGPSREDRCHRLRKWSASRMARASNVIVGLANPAVGKTELPAM